MPPDPTTHPELTGLRPDTLGALMPSRREGASVPSPSRGKALWKHLRERGLPDAWPEAVPGCGRASLEALAERVRLPSVRVEERHASRDGTLKWRLSCRGLAVETVLIPTPTRATVCVSTQSGCTRYCDFCATARMGFRGQLTPGEIVAQVLLARQASPVPVTNVVMMGMGEPLDNFEAVAQAIAVMDEGLQLSPRHVTVSTSGLLPQMQRLWAETRACLALSLHATTQEARDQLMPRVARWPLSDLCGWMRTASAAEGPRGRHFFIEYVLLAGHNDTEADAERLVALLEGVHARVNLIPFNPSAASLGIPYGRPEPARVRAFQHRLMQAGLICIVRETRGDDAAAACGQLAVGVGRDLSPAPPPPAS